MMCKHSIWLFLLLVAVPSTLFAKADDVISLRTPVGLFVNGDNDTITTSVASLACLYMRMKGYDPVNLNQLWKGKRVLHEKRAIRKRARKSNVESLIFLNVRPDDEKQRLILHSSGSREAGDVLAMVGITRQLFSISLEADIHEDTKKKTPVYSGSYEGACHLSTELVMFGYRSFEMSFDDPVIRLIGTAIDSLLWIIPESGRHTETDCVDIPVTVVCDKSFVEHYGESWSSVAAKQVYMANQILVNGLNASLTIVSSLSCDKEDIRSYEELLIYTQEKQQEKSSRAMIVFTTLETAYGKASLLDVGELGRAPVVGDRIVVSNTIEEDGDTNTWHYVGEGMIIAHEIGHMLGAVHTEDNSSIMYPFAGTMAVEFDSLNYKRTAAFLPLILGQLIRSARRFACDYVSRYCRHA